jgi:predicted ATPase
MNQPLRIVLTGGPGAGKTVVSRAIARRHPRRIVLVPEAATQVYDALQTRWDRLDTSGRREVQRKIYHLQVEQEQRIASSNPGKILLLDRGTIDGAAYWPDGPQQYWKDLNSSLDQELARYSHIIWMESCASLGVYDGDESNFCRFEDAGAAIRSGELLKELWSGHPRLELISACAALDDKIAAVEAAIGAG